MSKTVLKNTLRYFELLLEEMRDEWRAGTKVQRAAIERKAVFVKALQSDAQARMEKM